MFHLTPILVIYTIITQLSHKTNDFAFINENNL